jgi:peptidoglycan hydrolase-like protein with peptidoglycan-binding domain
MANLKIGSSGNSVKDWQKYLNTQGFNLKVDGIYGNDTASATKSFQKANGLTVDGIAGPQTLSAMNGGNNGANTATATGNAGSAPTGPKFNTNATAIPTAKPLPTNPTYDDTSWDDTEKGQAALGGYNSAKDAVNNYGDFSYEDYMESEAVKAAGDALNAHNANKPGEYQSQWQAQLDGLMNQIMNREKFSYDLNGDALYQQYKDKYIEQGKLAMADTMGQAAAMTGGYGSSYAQSVGQQAYQGQLDNLNDVVPELYAMALDKYNREGQDLYNQYGMVMDRENLDYGRYRDTVSDFLTDRDYLTGRYDTERGFDYGKYVDDRNLDYTLHQDGYQKLLDALGIAQGDYYNGADMFHSEQATKNSVAGQQFNDAMSIWGAENDQAWKNYQASEEARQYANSLLQQGYQNEFGEWEANNNEAWRQKEWERDESRYQDEVDRYEASQKATVNSNGTVSNPDGSLQLSSIPGINTNDSSYFDKNGNFKKAEFLGTTQDGESSFRIDGKTVVLDKGVNPYTQTYNPDCKKGTFSNGYQPNNVGGKPLKKSGIQDYMNGVLQTVWETPDGKRWIWDGTQNKYEEYTE